MRWIIEFAKAVPIVAVTVVMAVLIYGFTGISHSRATGLAAVLGTAVEGLLYAGILNLALGLILWRLLVFWVK